MLRNRLLFIINGSVILIVVLLLFGRFSSVPSAAQENGRLPGPANADVKPVAALSFLSYSKIGERAITASLLSHSLDGNGRAAHPL